MKIAAAIAIGCGGAAASQALTFYQIHEGTVSGIDGEGLFGAVGGDLTGAHFTLSLTLDAATASHFALNITPTVNFDNYTGPATVSLTINGQTVSETSGYLNLLQRGYIDSTPAIPNTLTTRVDIASESDRYIFGETVEVKDHIFASIDANTPFFYQAANGSTFGPTGWFQALDVNGLPTTSLTLFTSSVRGGAAPEPASWAMMVGGFAVIGAAMRRRRTVTIRFA